MNHSILEVSNLSLEIATENEKKTIINDISFSVPTGKITCIVGESGSGKSMTIRAILNLLPDTAVLSSHSSIEFFGKSIFSVFQDPMNSFNFSVKTGKQMYQMAKGYMKLSQKDFNQKIAAIMRRLRFQEPEKALEKYPFQLSGGMLQRMMLSCGILIKPSFIIADEPTTALDVTVQKEILREFRAINHEMKISILVVTHDFGVVAELADNVIVMNKGSIVEIGNVVDIFDHPQDIYTKRLIDASFKEVALLC